MERWELKLVCAFIIFVLSFIACLLPFKLLEIKWNRCCKRGKKQELSGVEANGNVHRSQQADQLNGEGTIVQESVDILVGDSNHTNPDAIVGDHQTHLELDQTHPDDHHTHHTHHRGSRSSLVLSYMLCLGGGVFLGAFLLHMLPEVIEIMAETSLKSVQYPVTFLLVGIGFFLVLATDVLVGYYQNWRLKKKLQRQVVVTDFVNPAYTRDNNQNSHQTVQNGKQNNDLNNHHDHSHTAGEEAHHHHHATRSIMLVLALSLHHIFEGISIGLQNSFSDVWKLTIAVLIHELVICFSTGLQFYKADYGLTKKVAAVLVVFSFVLPVGVFIGIIISEIQHGHADETQNLISGVLQALSSGSFLYVTFFEILFDELSNQRSLFFKTLFVFLGFGIEALLALAGHNHNHDHDHGDHDDDHHDEHDNDNHTMHHHDDHDDHTTNPAAIIFKNITKLIS